MRMPLQESVLLASPTILYAYQNWKIKGEIRGKKSIVIW